MQPPRLWIQFLAEAVCSAFCPVFPPLRVPILRQSRTLYLAPRHRHPHRCHALPSVLLPRLCLLLKRSSLLPPQPTPLGLLRPLRDAPLLASPAPLLLSLTPAPLDQGFPKCGHSLSINRLQRKDSDGNCESALKAFNSNSEQFYIG